MFCIYENSSLQAVTLRTVDWSKLEIVLYTLGEIVLSCPTKFLPLRRVSLSLTVLYEPNFQENSIDFRIEKKKQEIFVKKLYI